MNPRRVTWLLLIAVLVIAFAVWLSSRRHLERDLTAGELVLPGLEQAVNSVDSISLRKGDATHATLKKSGTQWQVAERGWPADEGKIRKLLLDLGALNIVEEKTRLPANYPALGVDDVSSPRATGTLVDVSAPPKSWALIVGKPSSAKSGFVRVAGTPQSLLAAPSLAVDADPKSWLRHELLDINAARVHQIDVKPNDGPAYGATRAKKDEIAFSVTPLPKGRLLTGPAAPEGLAGGLSGLQLDDVHKSVAVADAQLAHVVYRTFDGLEVSVAGHRDGAHPLVQISVQSSAPASAAEAQRLSALVNGWEFEIPDYKYTVLFTPLEELLQKPPEPAAKKSAAGSKVPQMPPVPQASPLSR